MIGIPFGAFKWVILWTDLLIFALVAGIIGFLFYARTREHYRVAWRQIRANPLAMICMGLVLVFTLIALFDSFHYYQREKDEDGKAQVTAKGEAVYRSELLSTLDWLLTGLRERTEKTFSAPFATHQYTKDKMTLPDGRQVRDYPKLTHGGSHLEDPADRGGDIAFRIFVGFLIGLGISVVLLGLAVGGAVLVNRAEPGPAIRRGVKVGIFLAVFAILIAVVAKLSQGYHVLGTDQVGNDVLYRALKGCRIGLIVGTLATLIATPLAILFGIMAGYFGGWLDDIVQYVYTTLNSIPNILRIAAVMLIVHTFVKTEQAAIAADTKLLWLCLILGIGSWTGLCRLLRGETLKVRENEYVQAAEAFGVNRVTIMFRHILPNVMHIVLISIILRFSGLVLAEAVLSYVGIGVDPSIESWGNMINSARLDISRDPVVWWSILAAFIFMFSLVLPANIFGDAVRDALDPRLKTE